MKAIDILKKAEFQYFQRISLGIKHLQTFDQHWELYLAGIVELDVGYRSVCGRGAAVDNNSLEFMEELEKEVVDGGFWVYLYSGHDGAFYLYNFDGKQDAKNYICELKDNPYVTSIFIVIT